MPDFPSPADGAVPSVGDSALDELLTAGLPPQDAAAGLQPVAAVLAALRAGPADGELAGQARVLAEFRSTVRVSHRVGRRRARRPAPLSKRLGSKLAVITAATAVAVSGMVAAAYFGALPAPFQQAAHDVIAAPASPAHGHAAAVGAHPLRPRSTATPQSHGASPPARHGQAGSASKHHKHKRHGRHEVHQGRRAANDQDVSGDQQDGPAVRRVANQIVLPQGKPAAIATPQRSGIPDSARRSRQAGGWRALNRGSGSLPPGDPARGLSPGM